MKIKVKIFDEKNGYSVDITTWRHRLIKQKMCHSLSEVGDFVTEFVNQMDGIEGVVDCFIEERFKTDQNATISALALYEEFLDWYVEQGVGRKVMSVTMFGRIMGRRFVKMKMEGRIVYVGLTHREVGT